MRVLSCLIESALVEAIQPAQWDKAMRVIGDFNPTFDVDDVITDLALADPTVSSRVEPPYSMIGSASLHYWPVWVFLILWTKLWSTPRNIPLRQPWATLLGVIEVLTTTTT